MQRGRPTTRLSGLMQSGHQQSAQKYPSNLSMQVVLNCKGLGFMDMDEEKVNSDEIEEKMRSLAQNWFHN